MAVLLYKHLNDLTVKIHLFYFFVTARPKQNARNSSKQGGQQQQQNSHQNNNQKTNATSVPQSQPPKSSNKSHKKFDINQKGANKEGTDMDAFNDNNVKETKETVIANNATTNSAAINDIINANSHIPNNVTAGVVNNNNSKGVINSVNNEINNKKFDSNETTNNSNSNMTIKPASAVPQQQPPPPQSTTLPVKPKSNKVDVTSIVREQPKVSTKPLPSSNNSTDETDRAAPTGVDMLNANNNNNNKMTSKINSDQTANNATTKTNSEIINTVESNLPYQEGKIFLRLYLFDFKYFFLQK